MAAFLFELLSEFEHDLALVRMFAADFAKIGAVRSGYGYVRLAAPDVSNTRTRWGTSTVPCIYDATLSTLLIQSALPVLCLSPMR